MKLIAKASIQIQKPTEVVFDGIVNPEKMSKYFISESSGPLETGKEVSWKFPEFPVQCTVKDIKLISNRSVCFVWDEETCVNINLIAQADNSTVVMVTVKPSLKLATLKSSKLGKQYEKIEVYGEPDCSNPGTSREGSKSS